MKDENFILGTLCDCEQVRIEDCPEMLFYVSGNTIFATYDNTTHILSCTYSNFWEYVEHIPKIRNKVKEGFNTLTRFTDCVTVRPGIYPGNYLERKRFEGVWDWETANVVPHYLKSPGPPSDVGGVF